MFWRWGLLFVAVLTLSGCVTGTGTDFAALTKKAGSPAPGKSRIVVLQEKANGLASCACEIKLDDNSIGKLLSGTYVYADRPAGRHRLSATELLYPGETKSDITTESGRTYFFLARVSERHNTLVGATIVTGLAGMLVTAAVTSGSDNLGPVDIFPLNDASARAAIAELQLAE